MRTRLLMLLLGLLLGLPMGYAQRSASASKKEVALQRAESVDRWLKNNGYAPRFIRDEDSYGILFRSKGEDMCCYVNRKGNFIGFRKDYTWGKERAWAAGLWACNQVMSEYENVTSFILWDKSALSFCVERHEYSTAVPKEWMEFAISKLHSATEAWDKYYKEYVEDLKEHVEALDKDEEAETNNTALRKL